jgi:hypothetical protein
MIVLSHKFRLILLAVVVLGAGLVFSLEVADWQKIEAVSLDGAPVEDWEDRLGLKAEQSVLEQPLSKVAARLLEDSRTARVDIDIDLPATLEIETNRFDPVCLVLDKSSGRLFGLNQQGRVLPLDSDHDNWEQPVVTGVITNGVFDLCDDPRVPLLVNQLDRLADDNVDLFRLIDEVDLTSTEYATLTVSGLPFRLRVSATTLHAQLNRFVSFLENYQPEVDSARMIDLRYANMIIQEAKRN